MTVQVLTLAAAKAAKLNVIENGRYTQAVHDVIVAMRANRRSGTACVKTKATVHGSGAKPWRQKGTGRARAGYKSSPIWRGGGVVFGPHPRDYSKKVNKATKRVALLKALSERIRCGDVLVVDGFSVAIAKTSQFLSTLRSITAEPRTLIVAGSFDISTYKAARNVQPARLMTAAEVNTEQLLAFRKVVLTADALNELRARVSEK